MTCDLCHRESTALLCDPCAEMIARISAADARMRNTELCIAQKMKLRADAEAKRQAEQAGMVTLKIQPETK